MAHREESVSAGTKSIAPVTINRIPVFVAGIPTPTIKDSVFAQSANGHSAIVGIGAAVNAAQVANKPAVVIGENASAWGDGAIAIGSLAIAGNSAAKDGAISIGSLTADGKNGISIGSALAFGSTFDDFIHIGTQAVAIRTGSIAIGKAASAAGASGIGIGTSSSGAEGSSIAIGNAAACSNSGLGTPNKNIAIGDTASCSPTFAGNCIAIGASARVTMQSGIAIGDGASALGNALINSIALGHGAATVRSSEFLVGDNAFPITLVTVRAGVAADVLHRVGGSGGWGIRDAGDANTLFKVDSSVVAGDCRVLVWDVSGTTNGLKRVTFGADNSAGAGFKWLRVAN